VVANCENSGFALSGRLFSPSQEKKKRKKTTNPNKKMGKEKNMTLSLFEKERKEPEAASPWWKILPRHKGVNGDLCSQGGKNCSTVKDQLYKGQWGHTKGLIRKGEGGPEENQGGSKHHGPRNKRL